MKSLLVLWEFGRRRLAKESRHLILISRLKMMKNELWCLACWQKLVIRGRSLPRITQLLKFYQLFLLVRWMGAKGTLPSRVDKGFVDNWTSKWIILFWNSQIISLLGPLFNLGDEKDEILPTFPPCQMPSQVNQGFFDNWTFKPRNFIETRKSAPFGGFC